MKLSNSKNYRKDLQKFENIIEKITDTKQKVYYQKLLGEFKYQAKIIDDYHSSYNAGMLQPHIIKNNVETLAEIRYQLSQLLKKFK